MNKLLFRSLTRLILAARIAAFATPILADAPAPAQQTANYEIKFMEKMIDHHAMAVMVAQMCTMKAIQPEWLTLCPNIITSQSAKIQRR